MSYVRTQKSMCSLMYTNLLAAFVLINSCLSIFMIFIPFVKNHDLCNSTILSNLNISFNCFWLYFSKMTCINGDIFFTYNLMINSLIDVRPRSQQFLTILPSNKVHHRASSEAYGALEQLLLNWGSTSSLDPRTNYTICSTSESLLITHSRLATFLFNIWEFD